MKNNKYRNNNRNRKTLNTSRPNNRINEEETIYRENENRTYKDSYRDENYVYRHKENLSYEDSITYEKNKHKKSKISFLWKLSSIISLIFIGFLILADIFFRPTKIFVIAIILFLLIVSYFLLKRRRAYFSKFILKILMIIASIAMILFMLTYLYTSSVVKGMNKENVELDAGMDTRNGINILILGLDTEGSIDAISRSDVNILTSINYAKDTINLTSIPRDTYLPIALGGNDQYDKLTHAGIYGVESSMKTIENSLDTPVNNYVKINFTSFIDLVDVIGGIKVNNDYAFTSINNIYFPEGEIELDGNQALAFVRERYALSDGDAGRGNNQKKALFAIISKLVSLESIKNFPEIMGVIEDSMTTNLPTNIMFNSMVEFLISGGFDSQELFLGGQDTMGLPSYAMPGYELYMFVPDEASMTEISNQINRLLNE